MLTRFCVSRNVMYVIQGGGEVAILRMFSAIPLHATCGIIRNFLGKAKMEHENKKIRFSLVI